MIRIDDHTFNEKLLTGGWVIDAGCRGFAFADDLRYGHKAKVYALDIENFPVASFTTEYVFKQAALTATPGQTEAYFFGNGTGNFVKGINGVPENSESRPCETRTVPCITLQDVYAEIGTDIDLLKLDIEGSEYEILENIEPIPRQITVEFHEHCHPILHNQYIDKVMEHLCKHYHCNLYIRDWPQYKYMDCLFIRKDLV
jgi:FkbM family methyltransferase